MAEKYMTNESWEVVAGYLLDSLLKEKAMVTYHESISANLREENERLHRRIAELEKGAEQ